MQFTEVRISEIIRETPDAITLCFDPGETPESFLHFIPGQHLTLRIFINFKEYRRSYSICSAQHESILKITIKKLAKGLVSNHLVDSLKEGMKLQISKPEGHFTIQPDAEKRQQYFFIAAGSGITPVLSMIRSLLESEPKSNIYLLYGNRNEENIIFYKELESLRKKYEGQLEIHYTLSKVKSKVFSFLSSDQGEWKGWKGRINEEMIGKFQELHLSGKIPASYYICGPGDMIEMAKHYLMDLNIDQKSIHAEYFTTPHLATTEPPVKAIADSTLIVHLNNKRYEYKIPGNKKILDFLLDAGVDPPYSCSSGACSTCMAKIISGEVKMDHALALEPDEIEQGFILTCQSRAVSSTLEITYD